MRSFICSERRVPGVRRFGLLGVDALDARPWQ
jgi:hypothetical protein